MPFHSAVSAPTVLRWSASAWLVVALGGQLLFALYVVAFYGRTPAASWNRVMPHGYVPGDPLGNAAVALHLLLAVLITLLGGLQLLPTIRRKFPIFHRYAGRVYLATAFAISLGGLFMVWTRGTVGGLVQHLSISLNALLIMACAYAALHHARRRQFAAHRRWALRLFLVSSGVWFFRIGLMFWLFLHRRPVGFDPHTFQGPFLTFLAFAQYLLPLAILELYLRLSEQGSAGRRLLLAATLALLTLITLAGTVAAALGMWLPRLQGG